MLGVSAMPHHHHNGIPCFKAITVENTVPVSDSGDSKESPCDEHCMAKFMYTEYNHSSHSENETISVLTLDILSYLIPEFNLTPPLTSHERQFVYIESLHSVYLSCATGLRAPPAFIA